MGQSVIKRGETRHMTRPKISVIMPVYNSEKHIHESIMSWINQSIDEKELICIDDGSEDASIAIISDFSKKHSGIRVIEIGENRGAGAARNEGIKIAKGEYISFLDSDDIYLRNDSLAKLYEYAVEGKSDICGGQLKYFNKVEYNELAEIKLKYHDYKAYEIETDYFFTSYIYKRSFLIENNIFFFETRSYEDPPFLLEALINADVVRVSNLPFYGYREHENVRETSIYGKDIMLGMIHNLKRSNNNNFSRIHNVILERLNSDFFINIFLRSLANVDEDYFNLILQINEIMKNDGVQFIFFDLLLEKMKKISEYATEDYTTLLIKQKLQYGKQIILYGAGLLGKRIHKYLIKENGYNIVAWIDKYKAGELIDGSRICGLQEISNLKGSFERVLICIADRVTSSEVVNTLKNLGVEDSQIVLWKD